MQQRAIDYAYGVIFSPATGGLFWTTWSASPQSDVLILVTQVSPSDIPPILLLSIFFWQNLKKSIFMDHFLKNVVNHHGGKSVNDTLLS